MYQCNINVCLHSRCCSGKAISIIHSECVSEALVSQHAVHMHCIIFPSMACLSLPIFPHYIINGMIFGNKVTEHTLRVFLFSTTFV
jgi:hypothetical protein